MRWWYCNVGLTDLKLKLNEIKPNWIKLCQIKLIKLNQNKIKSNKNKIITIANQSAVEGIDIAGPTDWLAVVIILILFDLILFNLI